MALTEIYVDPSLASDTGSGTIGDPYGDLEYAIEQETFDTTNGTRVNIKSGTDEVLAAALNTALADTSVSAAWAPSQNVPLVFQGYTATAGDGGIGGISGGGSLGIITGGTYDGVWFVDLHLHNCGSATVVDLDDQCGMINCEIDNSTGDGVSMDNDGFIHRCLIHNIGGIGAQILRGAVTHNKLRNGTNDFSQAMSTGGTIYRNIVDIDGASDGISVIGTDNLVLNNSVYSAAGTGSGIICGIGVEVKGVLNNLVEGFSGAGGVGFDLNGVAGHVFMIGGNSAYDNATDVNAPTESLVKSYGAVEVLSASPFTDAANGDFSPVDTGSVKEGSAPDAFRT